MVRSLCSAPSVLLRRWNSLGRTFHRTQSNSPTLSWRSCTHTPASARPLYWPCYPIPHLLDAISCPYRVVLTQAHGPALRHFRGFHPDRSLLLGQLRYGRRQDQLVRRLDDDHLLPYDCMNADCSRWEPSDHRLQCITAWFYPGQVEVRDMVQCNGVQLSSLAHNMTAQNSTPMAYGPNKNIAQVIGTPQQTIANPQVQTLGKRLEKLVEIYAVEGWRTGGDSLALSSWFLLRYRLGERISRF